MGWKRRALKMWTAAMRVKPPAASMTPQRTSKPIQRPQGNLSLRLVEAPKPRVKRSTVAYRPAAKMTASKRWLGRMRRQSIVMGTLLLVRGLAAFGGGDFGAALGDPPGAGEQDAAKTDEVGDAREHAVGQQRQRL